MKPPITARSRASKLLVALVLTIAVAIAFSVLVPDADTRRTEARIVAIDADLRATPPDAVLLAGNSHAQLAGSAAPNCTAWVNAGIGGIEADGLLAALGRIEATKRVRVAVLFLGTNEIKHSRKPLAKASQARFAERGARIIRWLEDHAEQVVVAAVPPSGAEAVDRREPAAVDVYSGILRDLCRAPQCRFADPFEALRGAQSGIGHARDLPDGVHLTDYRSVLARLDLCPRQ